MKTIILCGKAGSGKNYVLDRVLDRYGNKDVLKYLRLCTTRPRRENELDGIDYDFCTLGEFSKKQFVCCADYTVGEGLNWQYWKYGLEKNQLDPDKINIGIFSPDCILQFLEQYPSTTKIFYIQASPRTRLIRQMNRELSPDYSEICRRFLADEKDFKKLNGISFTKVRNDTFPIPNADIELIIQYIDSLVIR